MKRIFCFLLTIVLCFSACSSDSDSAQDIFDISPALDNDHIRNTFMDYGDFTDYITPDTDIPVWNKLCGNGFPDPANFRTQGIDPNKPMIALTFDDGPNSHTERLLDIFKTHGGKGTFFVVGNTIEKRENALVRMANEGHEIANHSWSHVQLTGIDEKELISQIMMTREKIFEITGKDSHLVRPPYGAYNDKLKSVGEKLGVYYANWSVDSLDWKSKNAKAVYNEIFSHVNNGSIILCHDLHKTTVDAMEEIIPQLIKSGYQLVTVSELLSYAKTPVEAGNIYYRR